MNEGPKIVIARQLKAPRTLVYRAFTDPDHLALWWGPLGNVLPRDEMDFDVRPGGHLRWTELSPLQPGLRCCRRPKTDPPVRPVPTEN